MADDDLTAACRPFLSGERCGKNIAGQIGSGSQVQGVGAVDLAFDPAVKGEGTGSNRAIDEPAFADFEGVGDFDLAVDLAVDDCASFKEQLTRQTAITADDGGLTVGLFLLLLSHAGLRAIEYGLPAGAITCSAPWCNCRPRVAGTMNFPSGAASVPAPFGPSGESPRPQPLPLAFRRRRTMIRITASFCAAVVLFGASPSLIAAPPTDEQIDQCIKAYNDGRAANPPRTMEDMKTITTEALGDLSIDEMSVDQISRLLTAAPILRYADGAYSKAQARLRSFESDSGKAGATACVLLFTDDFRAAGDDAAKAELIHKVLSHPAFDQLVEAGEASAVFGTLGSLTPEVAAQASKDIIGLERFIKAEYAEKLARSYIDFLKAYSVAAGERSADVKRIREKMTTLAMEVAEKSTEERTAKYYRGVSKYLNGAFARGELIGYKAPEVNVTWSSNPGLSSIGALKGQVVVLDFWATWCGPCVASFPKVRELVEHYQGYPVKIIGITSLQGFHIDSEADEKRIDTSGDPQKEYELMASYLKSRDITWDVVFTEQDVFNPDYGVRGIPHVAIIGPDGKVYHNGLHPAQPLKHKCELIDALLKDAGLPVPAPPAEEPAGDEG